MRRVFQLLACIALIALLSGAWLQKNSTTSAAAPQSGLTPVADPASDGLWEGINPELAMATVSHEKQWIKPQEYRAAILNETALNFKLSQAPLEFTEAAVKHPLIMSLPMPDGSFARFSVVESPIMGSELAANWKEIKTYSGQGIDDPTATVRFDVSPVGLRAMILSENDTVYIDPVQQGGTNTYLTYSKNKYLRSDKRFACEMNNFSLPADLNDQLQAAPNTLPTENPIRLRTYRLVVCANAEYGNAAGGGNLTNARAAVVTTVNRVSGLYERDLAVRLSLVQSYVFVGTTTADPFTNTANTDATTSWTENTNYINTNFGAANYDVGHFFSTGAGGAGDIGQVCVSGRKANGATGQSAPTGDGYDIDYVAHELGHQFGGRHTFNSGGGTGCTAGARDTTGPVPNAVEPGSGTTVMAYASICGTQDLQGIGQGEGASGQVLAGASDDYFHGVSQERIINNVTSGTSTCGVQTTTTNNRPTVNAGADYTIPARTPFTLTTTSASDPDGDALTYCWEQVDQGAAITSGSVPNPDLTTNAIFRSWQPSTSNSRTFPERSVILNDSSKESRPGRHAKSLKGETLPTTARTMKFRCTVRDNRAGGGGVSWDEAVVTTASNTTPFAVTSPNTNVSWGAGSAQTVTWDVAGTSAAPVNCANVRITLSLDGGVTFPTILASTVPNTGSASVTLPGAITSTTARIKVEAVGNIFFDISNTNFTITTGSTCSYSASPTSISVAAAGGTSSVAVTAGAGCSWTSSSGASWITVSGSGSGNGSASLTIAANTATTSRTGTATVAGQTISVSQAAASGGGGGGGTTVTKNYSNTTATAIPDNNTTGITSTINVPTGDNLTISSLSVSVNITHTWRGDVKVDLVGPDNTTVNLKATSSSDSADNVVATYTPTGFNGKASAGAWKLRVYDLASADTGTLNNWSMAITGTTSTSTPAADFTVALSSTTGTWTRGSSYTRTFTVTRLNGHSSPVNITYTAPTGTFSSVTASVNPLTTTSNSSTLTFTVSSTTTTGAKTVTIIGTDGNGVQRSATLSLTVQ
ncbi:MAG: proprotein convertase P-domain-containing protein [Blastocatellia bacterium]|nr:proprotein convertase P-domain-containing protein [Blastocatellia bacterium]